MPLKMPFLCFRGSKRLFIEYPSRGSSATTGGSGSLTRQGEVGPGEEASLLRTFFTMVARTTFTWRPSVVIDDTSHGTGNRPSSLRASCAFFSTIQESLTQNGIPFRSRRLWRRSFAFSFFSFVFSLVISGLFYPASCHFSHVCFSACHV